MGCPIRERRKRERMRLQCPVQIFRAPEGLALEASTVDLSADGVYWISKGAFSPGERIQCSIFITPSGFRAPKTPLYLHCRVHVVRVEATEVGFGVGCRIEQFVLLPAHESGAWADDRSTAEDFAYEQASTQSA